MFVPVSYNRPCILYFHIKIKCRFDRVDILGRGKQAHGKGAGRATEQPRPRRLHQPPARLLLLAIQHHFPIENIQIF